MDYMVFNLLELLDIYEENALSDILSDFMCLQNKDVENIIQTKGINFSQQRLAMTYLVFANVEQLESVGYFSQ